MGFFLSGIHILKLTLNELTVKLLQTPFGSSQEGFTFLPRSRTTAVTIHPTRANMAIGGKLLFIGIFHHITLEVY